MKTYTSGLSTVEEKNSFVRDGVLGARFFIFSTIPAPKWQNSHPNHEKLLQNRFQILQKIQKKK